MNTEQALAPLRARIDLIDSRLVALLAERMTCVHEVIAVKQSHALPARIESRIEDVVARVRAQAESAGAPPDLADVLWRTMIEWVIGYEERYLEAARDG